MHHVQAIVIRCRFCAFRARTTAALLRACAACRALLDFGRYERYELPIRIVLFCWDVRAVIAVVGTAMGLGVWTHDK